MEEFMNHDFKIDKIILACLVKSGKGALIHKNRGSYGLAIFLGGDRTFVFEGKRRLKVSDNTIVYFPKGSNYIIKEQESSDCYAINFDMPENIYFEPFAFHVKKTSEYLESFKKSERIWAKKSVSYTTKVKAELYNILYNMQTEYTLPYKGTSFRKIQPAIDYINSHYSTENISVDFLAGLCGMTSAHLRNCFKKNFGISTIKYINNLKLNRAEELIISNMYTINEVCFLSGFKDESYFSRKFKKSYGVSPSEYTKASRK